MRGLGTTPQKDVLTQTRIRYTQLVTILLMIVAAIGIAVQTIIATQSPDPFNLANALIIDVAVIIIGFVILRLLMIGRNEWAGTLLVLLTTLASVGIIISAMTSGGSSGSFTTAFIIVGIITMISAATLGNRLAYILSTTLVVGMTAAFTIQYQANQPEPTTMAFETTQHIVITLMLFITSITARYFVTAAEQTSVNAARSATLLEATAQVGQVMSRLLEQDQLLPRAVELIRDRFAFYHVQVFLVDEEREFAKLVASTGKVGQRLLKRQHQLAVGSQSVIGRVTQIGEPVIAGDAVSDEGHARNELLLETRAELALPLIDGDVIIGALDVQSTRANAFSEVDIQALQVMANQLTTAIRNARLFEAQQQSMQENKRLLLEAESSLRENQRLNQQLTQEAWSEYLQFEQSTNGVTLEDEAMRPGCEWTSAMIAAYEQRRAISTENGSERTITVPIILRGEFLGAIEVSSNTEKQDLMELVQSVAERLALSLDNTRLFEEAQMATAQEQRINEIVLEYQSATTVDDLLRVTIAELSDTLGAKTAAIRLGQVGSRNPSAHNGKVES